MQAAKNRAPCFCIVGSTAPSQQMRSSVQSLSTRGLISYMYHDRNVSLYLAEPVDGVHLSTGKHENIPLFFGKPKFSSREPGRFEFPLCVGEFSGDNARRLLLPGDPVEGHLRAHVVVEGSVGVVGHHLLTRALTLPHGLQAAVPMQQLEHGHELLELEHGATFIRLQHEAKRIDAAVRLVCVVRLCGKLSREISKTVRDHARKQLKSFSRNQLVLKVNGFFTLSADENRKNEKQIGIMFRFLITLYALTVDAIKQ
ncbi:hypothetical protein NPIL_63061 [Nephila pilipes]|uniref:Uncharacterized protein n=1 Tax=Nephila pilipes TaxID=299642 RepID=A0A8X6TZX2_NEPPI|nr:hypothetical protein NPIL_63061 [Nephila pilipes]